MQNGKLIFYSLDRRNFQEQFYQKLCSQDPLKIFTTTDLTKHLLSCPLVLMSKSSIQTWFWKPTTI